jgi:AcrR family transcriptional regulator
MKKTTSQLKQPLKDRGRKNVEAKLIKSACKLLAQNGPKSVTIRDIATHAGVNHGQIHHYFGGKKALITAAIRHMANEHSEHAMQRGLDDHEAPPPLSLAKDKQYIMSIIRMVLDGELELATLEIGDDLSIPRHVLEKLTSQLGYRKPTLEIKSAMAASMAIELAWAALAPYILVMVDASPNQVEKIRKFVAKTSRGLLDQLEPE